MNDIKITFELFGTGGQTIELYVSAVPRIGELLVYKSTTVEVREVCHDLDNGGVLIRAR